MCFFFHCILKNVPIVSIFFPFFSFFLKKFKISYKNST